MYTIEPGFMIHEYKTDLGILKNEDLTKNADSLTRGESSSTIQKIDKVSYKHM